MNVLSCTDCLSVTSEEQYKRLTLTLCVGAALCVLCVLVLCVETAQINISIFTDTAAQFIMF